MITLTIPDVPPSPNRVLGKHWRTKNGEKNKWVLLVRSVYLPAHVEDVKRSVVITLCHSRMYDKDNAYASVKPLVDSLKYWNLIVDDTSKWLVLKVQQEKCPHKQRHTTIQIGPAIQWKQE